MFFVIIDRLTAGFSLTLSRLFLVAFYAMLLAGSLRLKKRPNEPSFYVYLKLACIFFAYAALAGAFAVLLDYSFIQRAAATDSDTGTRLAQVLSYPATRVGIEHFTLAFTLFHYFFIGPRMILSVEHYRFLTSSFLLLCLCSLFLGLLSFGSAAIFGQNLLPRHFVEYFYAEPSFSGVRFQGLAGEPRDAVGQLASFGVALMFLRRFGVVDSLSGSYRWLLLLAVIAALLTLSASGIVGFAIFMLMFSVFQLFGARIDARRFIYFLLLTVSGAAVLVFGVERVERLALYTENFSNIVEQVNEGAQFSPIVMAQLNNFYPLIFWSNSCMEHDVGVCLFGGGFGSSFALNSHVYTEGLNNAHSYVSRLLPELGLVGFGLFLFLMVWPLFSAIRIHSRRLVDVSGQSVHFLKIGILLSLATVLAHKSNNFYILAVIVIMGLRFADPARVPELSAKRLAAPRKVD